MREYVLYEYCRNKISVMLMDEKPYTLGEKLDLICGYTGEESHYIVLGQF